MRKLNRCFFGYGGSANPTFLLTQRVCSSTFSTSKPFLLCLYIGHFYYIVEALMKQNIILTVPLFDVRISLVGKNKLVRCKFAELSFKKFYV